MGYHITLNRSSGLFYSGDTGPGLASRPLPNKGGRGEGLPHPDLLLLDCGASNRWSSEAPKIGHMTPELLKPELIQFRQKKGYLPPIVLVHMAPLLENEIKEEAAGLAKELNARISLGYEGMGIEV